MLTRPPLAVALLAMVSCADDPVQQDVVEGSVGPDGLELGADAVDSGAPPLLRAVPTEAACFDGLDDDGDGPRDCADSDCASACGCTTGGGGGPGDAVLWHYQSGQVNTMPSSVSSHFLGLGASRVDNTSTWPANILDYRLVFLVHPPSAYSASQVADIQTFAAAGGTLVLIGEGSGYTNGYVSVFNGLHPTLGLSSTWVSNALDSGCTWYGTVGAPHPLNTGLTNLPYAYTSDVSLSGAAVSVVRGSSGQVLVAEENGVIFVTDSNVFDGCTTSANSSQFYTNLWNHNGGSTLLDTDGDGVHDNCDQCPGYDDADDADSDYVPDECDVCDLGDDYDDADTDSVPDACDVCAGAPDVDGDGDGTFVCNDCDDADPAVYPGALEVTCNAKDDDCDALTPDDPDGDGDGAGICTDCDDADPGLNLLDQDSDGYTTCDADCDDTLAFVNPAGTEVVCNGVDDDCNVATPDDTDADGDGSGACLDCNDADPVLNLQDADGDGVASCDGDCDDTDPGVGPAALELPDGIDNDCDGTVDEGTIWYDDDGDGVTDAGGDCGDGDPTVYPGALELCDGIDNDCDGLVDEGTDCYDDDGDGYTELDGDCNDADIAVNPSATEDFADGIDNDCDGVVDDGANDQDGDGVTADSGDCDDADPDVYPGAPELADGIDNDCDGIVDEGTGLYDDDGDGFSEQDGDCDDSNAQIHPGATELADGLDNDCDGLVDEDTDVSDDDGDGYTEIDGDCDDADASVHPGAPDVANGIDDDCDGQIDEDALDVDGDGVTEADGDCDDDDGWVHPGAAELCDQLDNDCDDLIDEDCLPGPVDADEKAGGCGCASGAPAGALPVVWAVGLLALRRRQSGLGTGSSDNR